jgi:hypothetical protein
MSLWSDSEGDEHDITPPAYCYEPLPDIRPVHHIRVLKFVRTAFNDDIACELLPFDIQENEKYVAISWAWGKRSATTSLRNIVIRQNNQDCLFPVPITLVGALKRFRAAKVKTLWIDFICINQKDDKEKSHQIPMMSEIYGRAWKVFVWLGEADDDSRTALHFIKKELSLLRNFDKLCSGSPDEWCAVLRFAQRSWFTRRWVIQEISVARGAVLFCGDEKIDWRDFADAIQLVLDSPSGMSTISAAIREARGLNDWYDGFDSSGASLIVEAATTMFRRSGGRIKTPILGLEYLVSKLSIFEVTEPRDAIYSLLAVARDVQASADANQVQYDIPHVVNDWVKRSLKIRYLVDYEQPYRHVCRDYISFCVQTADDSRALDVICRPWAFDPKPEEEDRSMPSWVPSRSRAAYELYTHATFERKMDRKNADALVGFPAPIPRTYGAAGTLALRPKKIRFKTRNSYDSMYVSGFILDRVEKTFGKSESGHIPQEWFPAGGWEDMAQDPPDEFWRTLVGNRDKLRRNPPLYYQKVCKESITKETLARGSLNTSEFIKEGSSSIISEFYRRVQAIVYNRTFINTRGGKIGLVDKDVRHGDLICILYGCSVPVVLRQRKKSASQIQQERAIDKFEEQRDALKTLVDRFGSFERFRGKLRDGKVKARQSPTHDARSEPSLIDVSSRQNASATPKSPPAVKAKPAQFRRPSVQHTIRSNGQESLAQAMQMPNFETITPPSRASSIDDQTSPIQGDRGPSTQRTQSREVPQDPKMQELAQWIAEESQPGVDEEFWYKFCGECYLHGMMDGEAVEFKNVNPGVKRHYFELR